jgi:tetraacyldisaccharide 4'-kinase
MTMSLKAWLERRWYSQLPPPLALRPLAALYGGMVADRRRAQLIAADDNKRLPVPVVVVGNITIGGTGKTPFAAWLVERLRQWGWNPGIVSRGYGGRARHYPLRVTPLTAPGECGDEPALLARRLRCPVVVDSDRRAAARALLSWAGVDIIVADDGLQHYALSRDVEICVVDGVRGLGNGAMLPAGPLREPVNRLMEVDLVVVNGGHWQGDAQRLLRMQLDSDRAVLVGGGASRPLRDFAGQTVHALAGIGHPQRFFDMLKSHGIEVVPHAFPDHHPYGAADLDFAKGRTLMMTEKDAVKCTAFAEGDHWSVPVTANIAPEHEALVQELVAALRH